MRSFKLVIAIALFGACIIVATAAFTGKKNPNININNNKGFAVIELFTSEGCSSCPPADALVAKIQKESAGQPVYILAFHVDYWNRLGWKDVFSSAEYSHRQNQYAGWLHLSEIYTPQIVVNGRAEFVGSEEGTLRNAIKTSLQKEADEQISLGDVSANKNKIKLNYQAQGNINNTVLQLALIQKSAQTKVERGENGGRTLSHVQIVRLLQSVPLKNNSGATVISLPKGFDVHGAELIAFLQNNLNGTINAATKADL